MLLAKRIEIALVFLWCLIIDSWVGRLARQLLNSIIYPLVLRFRHWTESLMGVESLQNVVSYLFFKDIGGRLSSWRLRKLFSTLTCWLAAFCGVALLSLNFICKASAACLSFATLLDNQTLSILLRLGLIVDDHLLELVHLERLHKYLLLLLELQLLLRVLIQSCLFPHISRYVIQTLLRVWWIKNRKPDRTLACTSPFDSVFLVCADIALVTRIHLNCTAFEG